MCLVTKMSNIYRTALYYTGSHDQFIQHSSRLKNRLSRTRFITGLPFLSIYPNRHHLYPLQKSPVKNNNDEGENNKTFHNKRQNPTPHLNTILCDRLLEALLMVAYPLTPELNPSAQRCLTRFLLVILLLEMCISLI
jgi:hypothetical protein